jgi:hypothetical protein
MLTSAVHVKQGLNSFESGVCFDKSQHSFRFTSVSLFLTSTSSTPVINAQLIAAGDAACGKLTVYRCIETEINILLSAIQNQSSWIA